MVLGNCWRDGWAPINVAQMELGERADLAAA